MTNEIIIHSEEEAYGLLQRTADKEFDLEGVSLRFEGWPKVHIHLEGEKYQQTITPSMMKGFLEMQKAIYRAYALSYYNTPNIRHLTQEEWEILEIEVKVSEGSSDYDIDLQDLLTKLFEMVADKLSGLQVVAMVLGIAVMYFGHSSFRLYLENRKETREKELKSEEQRALVQALKFTGEQETKRAETLAGIVKIQPQLENIEKSAHDAQTAIVKSIATADVGEYQGVALESDVAKELTKNARRKSEEVRLDGRFRIIRVDSSDPTDFKVRIRNIETGEILDASVQDSWLNERNKSILQDAEWSRKPVDLKINAKELRGEIKNAVVIDVTQVDDDDA